MVVITEGVGEQTEVTKLFAGMLHEASKDGGAKRDAGTKIPWQIDKSHEAAIFSHLDKWKHGEFVDPDSGAHPLVHLAWRALAIAWQETHPEEANEIAAWWYTFNVVPEDLRTYPENDTYFGNAEDEFSYEFWAAVHGDSPM